MLGSGMDARPWRLALPPGVAWFEVDRADVLSAKQRLLRAHGVQLSPARSSSGGGAGADNNGGGSDDEPLSDDDDYTGGAAPSSSAAVAPRAAHGGAGDGNGAAVGDGNGKVSGSSAAAAARDLRLRVASWRCVAADLQQPGWSRKLIAAGLDTQQRICWCVGMPDRYLRSFSC